MEIWNPVEDSYSVNIERKIESRLFWNTFLDFHKRNSSARKRHRNEKPIVHIKFIKVQFNTVKALRHCMHKNPPKKYPPPFIVLGHSTIHLHGKYPWVLTYKNNDLSYLWAICYGIFRSFYTDDLLAIVF